MTGSLRRFRNKSEEVLTFAIETLRKLENHLAIARFSGQQSQVEKLPQQATLAISRLLGAVENKDNFELTTAGKSQEVLSSLLSVEPTRSSAATLVGRRTLLC